MGAGDTGLGCRGVGLVRRTAAGERPVLREIEVHFRAGECSLVAGPTGSGKSTLLQLLGTLLRPSSGDVIADGQAVSRWTAGHRDRWRRQLGLIFQRPELWPELTALENVLLPEVPGDTPLAQLQQPARDRLTAVGAGDLALRPAGELSLGERQRVAVARALIRQPRFVLADEPTAHQDDDGTALILAALAQAAAGGAVVVLASHDPRVTGSGWPDRCWQLQDGRLRPADRPVGESRR